VLNAQFPYIAAALKGLPDETVIDGDLVALASDGRPNFNLLQNYRSAESHIICYAFDVMTLKGRDLTQLPLSERREVLRSIVSALPTILELDSVPAGGMSLVHGSSVIWQIGSC
jgi:ATP-dependent DNA ligase